MPPKPCRDYASGRCRFGDRYVCRAASPVELPCCQRLQSEWWRGETACTLPLVTHWRTAEPDHPDISELTVTY